MATTYIYTIDIHMSRKNALRATFVNIPFQGASEGQTDEVIFSNQKIKMKAIRTRRFTITDVFKSRTNTLYVLILKSLIYLYAYNKTYININSITFTRTSLKRKKTEKQVYTFSNDEKPIEGEFVFPYDLPECVLNEIWEENREGDNLRIVLTHYLRALSSDDRSYAFECHWRSFEQLCLFHNRIDSDNNDFTALGEMRRFICFNQLYFTDAITFANRISLRRFMAFDWEGYVRNEYPTLAETRKPKKYTKVFRNHFVMCNRDLRVIEMLDSVLHIRSAELQYHGVIGDITNYISAHKLSQEKCPEHVLCMLCCKYAYYLRNKMFHGEVPEFSFSFSNKTKESMCLDTINLLLLNLNIELLLIHDRL